MNLSDDFDPREPDLALLCKDGKEVKARSYIVMLASQPLLPAIKMALGEAASGRSSYQLAAPAGQCPDAAGSQHSEIPADMAVCRMEEDSAEAWQLLLQFLDPNQLHPDITWDNVEPLLLLANKYDIQVPLQLCTQFLDEHFSPAKYASLPEEQLARLPAWLATTRELQMFQLHSSIMACLEDNLARLVYAPSASSLTSIQCGYCRSVGYGGTQLLNTQGYCGHCGRTDAAPAAAVASVTAPAAAARSAFRSIWGVTAHHGSTSISTIKEQLAVMQWRLAPEEAMQLLMAVVAKEYKG